MATNSLRYRYGKMVVEVKRISEISPYVSRYECLVRGYGHGSHVPRKIYTFKTETTAKAARIAIEMYRIDYPENGQEKH